MVIVTRLDQSIAQPQLQFVRSHNMLILLENHCGLVKTYSNSSDIDNWKLSVLKLGDGSKA